MGSWYVFAVTLCAFTVIIKSEDLQVGNTTNEMVYVERVKLSSIPLTQREKNVFFNNGTHPRVIRGILAIDLDKSKAKATITSGGVDSTFVNVRLKSVRGKALNYQVQVYV